MFNFAEILTIISGTIVALVLIDGLRRASKARNKLKLKQGILSFSEQTNSSNKSLQQELPETSTELITPSPLDKLPISIDKDEENTEHQLLIINISSADNNLFSSSFLSKRLARFNPHYEQKGFFTFRNTDNSILFTLLNSKNPGTFSDDISSSDVSLVLDPSNVVHAVDAFDLFWSVAQYFSDVLECDVLDENRNILTKQMLEHMRYKAQEYQRQHIANVS